MNDVNGEVLGLDEDDEVPLMEGVLRDTFGAWDDGSFWVRSMKFVCGGERVILGLLFDRYKDVEGDSIVEDKEDMGDDEGDED